MDHGHDHLTERLRSLGEHPIDDDTKALHRQRMDAAEALAPAARRRFGPVAIAAAGIVGFMAGSTGLAAAGALPDPAQDVAHEVLGVVRVDVPKGKEGQRGPCVSQAAKIEDEASKQAAKDACPKGGPPDAGDDVEGDENGGDENDAPGRSGDAPGQTGDLPNGKTPGGGKATAPGQTGDLPNGKTPGAGNADAPGQVKHADDPCKGRPAWAGPMSKDEREALKEAGSRADCDGDEQGDDLDDDDLDDDDLDGDEQGDED